MKKLALAAALALVMSIANAQTVSENREQNWLALGFEWGNYWEILSSGGANAAYYGSPGPVISYYHFGRDKRLGFFSNMSFLFPVLLLEDMNGSLKKAGPDFFIQYNLFAGPAFRFPLNERMAIFLGAGIDAFWSLSLEDKDINAASKGLDPALGVIRGLEVVKNASLGVGGDFRFKFDFNHRWFFTAGSAITVDFLRWESKGVDVEIAGENVTVSKNKMAGFFALNIRPHVGFGVSF
ncbi:MAG: hypothetical protein LBG84_05425 [Treponema sp.]|jgi:hypothetical protein|nr:hypothetical protein [Treponema sp.]